MDNNTLIDIAQGSSAGAKTWRNKKYSWEDLVAKFKAVHKTRETFKEYKALSKTEQSKIKDVGGYIGGYLRSGRRSKTNVVYQQLLTLDLDYAHLDFWSDFILQYSNEAILHQSHSHSEENPKYRLIIPLSREVQNDEYLAISRKVAETLDMSLFDPTSFQVNRLMFWPSISSDVTYYFKHQKGEWLDPDFILNLYDDWKDLSSWPLHETESEFHNNATDKQEDPHNKKGLIGAFCRTYTIEDAIQKFIPDKYIKSDVEDRWTYTKGSAAAGLINYDNKFAYSHHASDPCGNKLCNSFDLVRIHKFGTLDNGTQTKSFAAMEDLVKSDSAIKKLIAIENFEKAKYDFEEPLENEEDENLDWTTELEIDSKGNYLSSSTNINIIFANDKRLRGLFKSNIFDNKSYIFGNTPWRKIKDFEPIKNVDYSGVRNYLECIYGIVGNLKIDDVMNLELEKNSFHPIKDYLNSLVWDGTSRVDNLLIDYLGAENSIYSKEAIRKVLVAAVARIFKPGIKFDLVLVLVGDQGTGKSTFVKKLGREWFSDTFLTVHGKEALEQIQGAWIIELAELAGLRKAEVESIKHFISKQEDTFRPAYGRTAETYKRQCIFIGTTNNKDFLRDPSGNRRFIPIDINSYNATKSVFSKEEFDSQIDQIWAEAVELFKAGELLYMSTEAEKLAKFQQSNHSENDSRSGLVEQYLDTLLPENWDELDLFARRLYLSEGPNDTGKFERDYVCIAELWCECLGKEKEDMTRYNTREINDIMKNLKNWELHNSTKNFKIYGKQKYYSRKLL